MKSATAASVRNVRKGLRMAKEDMWMKREKALRAYTSLESKFFDLGMKILVDKAKEKDRQRYKVTEDRLIQKSSDCKQHEV